MDWSGNLKALPKVGKMVSFIESQRKVSIGRSSSMYKGCDVGMGLLEDREG